MSIDQILRDGAGPEFCELWEVLREWRRDPNDETIRAKLARAFDACERIQRDFDDAVDEYKASDGTPGEFTTSAGRRP
jgi:hypothetical protein